MQKRPLAKLKRVFGIALLCAGGFAGTASAQTWMDQDVGNFGQAGDHSVTNGVWTVRGAGVDIWGTADGFHFVYQQLSGDGQIVVKVDTVGNTSTFAKAGVMMRNGTAAGDAHVVLDLKPGGGTELMTRATTNGSTTFIAGTSVAAPYWLKLVRSGGTIAGYQSSDANTWTLVGTATDTLNATIDVGLIVCSHDTSTLNTSTFEGPAISSSSVPTSYDAITDTNPRTKPAPPTLGSAGYKFTDPTFGSQILRVTDQNTRPSTLNKSYRVASNSHLNVWNTTSTYFYVTSTDGTIVPFSFNGTTMTASRLSGTGDGGFILGYAGEPIFSTVDPERIYGVQNTGPHVIRYFQMNGDRYNPQYTDVLNLDTVDPALPPSSVVGGLMSGGSPERMIAFFGGSSQDQHYEIVWFDPNNVTNRKVINTLSSTINGTQIGTNLDFHLHSASIDRSGRYVFLGPTGLDLGSPRFASQVYVWDTVTDVVTAITSGDPNKDGGTAMLPAGHDATGYGYWINEDCCSGGSWDAAQWQFRSLGSLTQTSNLINPVLTPEVIYMADHESWNNASASSPRPPVFMSTYRYCHDCGNETAGVRAWDDEIIGIDTTHTGAATTVWRFAHHQSIVQADNGAEPAVGFWYEPIADVSPNGLWMIFTSNWGKTLGTDPGGDPTSTHRQDVFLLQLTPSGSGSGGGGTQNVAWTNTVNATATGNSLQKTGGCDGCQDAGGVSAQSITSGTGYFTFTAAVNVTAGPSMYVGIGNGLSQPPQYGQFAYSFSISPNNGCDIREFGVWKADCSWASTDVFKIAIESDGRVHFYKNSTSLYTSTTVPGNYPYVLGADFFNVGVSVNNAAINTP